MVTESELTFSEITSYFNFNFGQTNNVNQSPHSHNPQFNSNFLVDVYYVRGLAFWICGNSFFPGFSG